MENANIMWYEADELAIGFNSMPHVCVRYITPSMTEYEVKSIKKYPFIKNVVEEITEFKRHPKKCLPNTKWGSEIEAYWKHLLIKNICHL